MFNNSYMSQYFLYILAFAVVMLAQSRVQAAYHKYKRIPNEHGLTGEAVARRILDMNNLQSIRVEVAKGGMLSDHYDPVHHVVRLSPDLCMIFCNTKKMVDELCDELNKHNIKAISLHGDMKQEFRSRVMEQFRSGHC